jgi:predicted amidohydrolase YtcJ
MLQPCRPATPETLVPRPRLLTNARVHGHLGADAVAIADGRIVAVGAHDDIIGLLPTDAVATDLGGGAVLPGFIDSHLHPMPMCFFESAVDLSGCRSVADVLDALADRASSRDADGWVFGVHLDDEVLAERRLPSRVELDGAGGGRPTVILRRDGHHAVGSTAALAASGIDRATPDPPGGVIHRDGAGELTGLCGETASGLLLDAVALPAWDEFVAALDRVVTRLARHGVTGISAICQTTAEGPAGRAGELESVAWSMLIERVPFDVQTILIGSQAAEVVADHRTGPLHRPDAGRRLDAVKLFLDGTLGGHTACMRQPFHDAPVSGMLTADLEASYEWMVASHAAGLQICIHAIGDRATAEAAGLFERLLREHPADHRHRVEHASVLDDATIERLAVVGVAAVVQPISIETERHWLADRLGPERIGSVYPFRRLLDGGVELAGSSDAPIESVDVIGALRCATDRGGVAPDQAITPAEAVALYTSGGAWVRRVEDRTGAIVAGHDADLVVLSRHPVDAGGFTGVEVLATMARGRLLHAVDRLGLGDPPPPS